jgi:ribosomal protein S26
MGCAPVRASREDWTKPWRFCPKEDIMSTNLPRVIDAPISHDLDKVAAITDFDRSKVGGKKGYRLPDGEEQDLVNVIRTGYVRCIRAGNHTPTIETIIGSSKRSMVKDAVRDAVGKGNGYGRLLVPVLDGSKSPYWALLDDLLRHPAQHGFDDIPGLRADVELVPTGKDLAEVPVKD